MTNHVNRDDLRLALFGLPVPNLTSATVATPSGANYTLRRVNVLNRFAPSFFMGDLAMRKFLLLGAFFLFCGAVCQANDIYIGQSGSGSGTSCSSTLPASFFNASGNWGGGSSQIGPGTTVHLCGTISTTLVFQGGGSSGNPVTLLAESGAVLSQPAGMLINLNGQNNILLNGGTNGIMQNTANGTNLANQSNVQAVYGTGAANVEMKNWTIQNMYIAVPPVAASGFDQTLSNCYYAQNYGGTILIHDNVMHDVGWCVNMGGPQNGAVVNVYNNNIYNMDHGVVVNAGPNQAAVSIDSNHFGATANWDTSTDAYHHDPIHVYGTQNAGSSWMIYNNLFDGNQGSNNTANEFFENTPPNVTDFNNVHIGYPGNVLNDGFVSATNGSSTNFHELNNTFQADPTVANMFCLRITSSSGAMIENNAISGCNTFISAPAGFSGTINYNVYADQGAGGCGPLNWEASGGCGQSLGTWQANCGCDANSSMQSSLSTNSVGLPSTGSALLTAGTNLSGLGISALDSDTTAGDSRTSVARPSSGSWAAGAYAGTSSSQSSQATPPSPPSGLSVSVQ